MDREPPDLVVRHAPGPARGGHRQDRAEGRRRHRPVRHALAAYQRVRDSWQAGVSNSVVIYTDGQNDSPGGLTIDQLVERMNKLRDPAARFG
jgi:hypothetical protein